MNPDLIQSFYNPKNLDNFTKGIGFLKAIGKLLGKGLLLDERDMWKKKKKILTEVFTHDFIKNLTYDI